METGTTFLAVAVAAVLFAGLSKGGFGGGAGFVATPLIALAIDPARAVALMLPLLMLMDLASLRTYWRKWSWPHARRLMLGAVPGVVAGALFFRLVSADGIRLMIGTIAIAFVAFQVARARGWLQPPPRPAAAALGYFWGGVAGFTSFVSHAGGPPAAMYLLGSGLDKTRYQASTVVVFWWVNLIKFPIYLALGMFDPALARLDLLLAPVAVAGVAIGVWAHRVVAERLYFRITYSLLLAAGGKLVYDALA